MNIFIALILILFEIFVCLTIHMKFKNILHPALLFNVYISAQLIISLVIFNDAKFSFYGFTWIIISLSLFTLGCFLSQLLIDKKQFSRKKIYKEIIINEKLNNVILTASIILGMLFTIEFLFKNGFSVSSLFNFSELLDTNKQIAQDRYTNENVNVSNISRIFLIFTYFSPLIGGFSLNLTNTKPSKILSWCSLIPSLSIVLVQNTKAAWVAGVLLFISGYFVSYLLKYKQSPKIKFKRVLIILILVFSFVVINYLSLMFRMGTLDLNLVVLVNKKITLYIVGHIPAFEIWFTNNSHNTYSLGLQTFYGIADFLGIINRQQGIYTEVVYWKGGSTNVYSIFRSFIEDFGVYLSLLIYLFLGFIVNVAYQNTLVKSKLPIFSILILTSFYFYILFVFTSAWSYMSYIFSFLILGIYLKIIKKERS